MEDGGSRLPRRLVPVAVAVFVGLLWVVDWGTAEPGTDPVDDLSIVAPAPTTSSGTQGSTAGSTTSAPTTTASAPEPRVVPDLRGQGLAEARENAATAGYRAVVSDYDPQSTNSVVIAQEPGAGVAAPRDAVIGLRTASVFRVDCGFEDTGPSFVDVPATYGGITLVGLRDGVVVDFADYPSPDSGWYPVVEIPIRVDQGTEPIWLVVRQGPVDGVAGLLFDPEISNDTGRYRMEDTTQAVTVDRCHTDAPTQYMGGLVADRPGCVGLWLYDGSLATEPTIINLGIDTACEK